MLVRLLRRYAAFVWIAILSLAGLGVHAIFALPSGIYPEMVFPRVVVVAHAGQIAADLVEAQVTRPLEQALAVVPGVRYVRARTIRGAAELSLQLTDQADPLQAQYACQAAVDHVELPNGTTTIVERVLPTSVPVITFNLSMTRTATTDPRRLREVAERIVRPAIARVPGVGAVELIGGTVREVEIVIHPDRLAPLHVTPAQLAAKLEQSDRVVAAGRVLDQHQTLPVVLDAQAGDLAQLRALPIANGPDGPIPLSVVADVIEGAEDPSVIVRGPRGEVVAISVARLPGASTLEVVDRVALAVRDLSRSHALPADVELRPVYDQAELVDEALTSVRDAILIGIALSLIVIALALGDLRAGLVAAIPVPLTLLGTFAVMSWLGITLNLMSLGGLAVAIGLVVDDAIVVTEGIVRRAADGCEIAVAIELGTADMFAAVVGTTFTTVVVFAPLALLTGVTGRFLGALAGTLVIAVLLSMIMSLSLIPLLARVLRRRPARPPRAPRHAAAIRWLVRHRGVAVGVVALLIVVGYLAQRNLATGFLPAMDEGTFVIDFFLPPGTSLEETDRIATAIDDVLRRAPEVAAFTRRTGTELGPATATVQSRGDIMVKLIPPARRGPILDVIARVRGELHARVPEARLEYVQVLQDVLADLSGNPSPIEVKLLGDDRDALEAWAEKAGERLARRDELVDVFDGREGKAPILRSRIEPLQLARLGVSVEDVGADLSIAITGREVAQILRPERAIGVRLRYPDAIRWSPGALARSLVAYGPRWLPLGEVVTMDRPIAPAVLRRDGLRPAIVMTAATILVLLVLILQLRSLAFALVVLASAPLSTVGGLLVLAATGIPLDVSSLTGLILLVGLVVKNGILLLEHARHELARGGDLEAALIAAARRRLRPILMTTGATLAGLTPLALGIGAGAELQRPLAVAVIGGLTLATAVTLVVTPGLTALVANHRASS